MFSVEVRMLYDLYMVMCCDFLDDFNYDFIVQSMLWIVEVSLHKMKFYGGSYGWLKLDGSS